MSQDATNIDQLQPTPNSQTLYGLATGPLYSSVSNLLDLSHCIPSNQDFHHYYNFDEFKLPIGQIACSSHSMLQSIGAFADIWGKPTNFPEDMGNAYGWLVDVNNEVLGKFDLSMDKFQSVNKNAEEGVKPLTDHHDFENGSQLVCENENEVSASGSMSKEDRLNSDVSSGVKTAIKDEKKIVAKPKVPFHVHTIRRPQDQFNILVNNSNQPFEHVWLERSEDGLKYIHPLDNHSFLDFVDKDLGNLEPKRPPSLEVTPFRFVDQVKDLKDLASKLRGVNEFAVDLEHNQYRSFQGLTCLMQISTRTEDFVVDTLKLRIHVGPYLREVFKDPTKRKVMHGADRDIIWLQRDFGIYVCNLFDTGQASKVLKLERNSLEHLLRHFCEVTANKEYQNADWRMRPLPKQMIRYAREDTHYLLYIYDLMRIQLFSTPKTSEESEVPLVEVYQRSYDVCLHLYEKELLNEKSYQRIYGLQEAGFAGQQLAVLSALFKWRDAVARAEDESTGYILPNKALLEIAKQMPVTSTKLRGLVRSKHPYVECNLDYVLNIIRNSMRNGAAFEATAKQLKEIRNASVAAGPTSSNRIDATSPMTPNLNIACGGKDSVRVRLNVDGKVHETSAGICNSNTVHHPVKNGKTHTEAIQHAYNHHGKSLTIPSQSRQPSVLQKPVGAFPRNLALKRKTDAENKEKEDAKLEQIRSSGNLPFPPFGGSGEHLKPGGGARPKSPTEMQNARATISEPASSRHIDEVIILDSDSDAEEQIPSNSKLP